MVTANILQRTFKIKSTDEGTCFTIDVDNRQYIVTARHIVEGIFGQSTVKIMQDKKWKNLQVTLVGHSKGTVDISVLAAEVQISPTHPLSTTTTGIYLGQDVYFLGFPYELTNEAGKKNMNFPLPLVKKGIVSMFEFNENIILLDGHNNPGFSGGPVVFHPKSHSYDLSVAGVVAGYRFDREPVYKNQEQEQKGKPLGYYKANTGIIVTYEIKHALKLIRQNPIGLQLEINKP